jgi:hypothetical protein
MQDALQLLLQYRLLHLQVHLLHAEKNLAFLQHPAKVGELFGLGTRGAPMGEEVPLDGISTSVTTVMFRRHLPDRTRKSRQAFLPRDDRTLLAI